MDVDGFRAAFGKIGADALIGRLRAGSRRPVSFRVGRTGEPQNIVLPWAISYRVHLQVIPVRHDPGRAPSKRKIVSYATGPVGLARVFLVAVLYNSTAPRSNGAHSRAPRLFG
jgi:hypothetical protein